MTTLVIVESPAKARTIEKYLGADYHVEASVGHIRDLAQPSDLPEKEKHGKYAKFAVDVDGEFEPYYVVNADKKKTVSKIKTLLKQSDELLLATDEDREGEAIAWHILEVIKPKIPVKRMVFHEITKEAITKAIAQTRDINLGLVDAQETRRILDRLFGYEISPLLWRKIAVGLSAGRVQSVATRLVVERERERMGFVSADYASVEVVAQAPDHIANNSFTARLVACDKLPVALGRDFDDHGKLTRSAQNKKVTILDANIAAQVAKNLTGSSAKVVNVESKPYTRRPSAPFTTSTLQQEASRKIRMSSRDTMSIAQRLYENGYITYMRTDSTVLSTQALQAARATAIELYGSQAVPSKPRVYGTATKGAQEAHEAIRPAGEAMRHPKELQAKLSPGEYNLYEIIWKRTLASQMIDASGYTATISLEADIEASKSGYKTAQLRASGTVITTPGFRQVYEEGRDSTRYDKEENSIGTGMLPELTAGQKVDLVNAEAGEHTTRPPERYTDASIIKQMEELGIGRPSTYAATISRIAQREYVVRQGQTLVPTWLAFSVVRLIEENLPDLIDYTFTAEMEAEIDKIAAGKEERITYITKFWRGDGVNAGLEAQVTNLGDIDARALNSRVIGENIVLRVGKFGPYVEQEQPGETEPKRANIPAGLAPDELTIQKAQQLLERAEENGKVLGIHPDTGLEIVAKDGRFGPYVQEALPQDAPANAKPRTASLIKSMDIATLTLADALKVISLPRTIGKDEQGNELTALNGRYGPYLSNGSETRMLDSEEELFTITLEQALEIFSQPKRRRSAKAPTPAKVLGTDPVSGKPVSIKDGRFGPYVTDGEVNASLRTGDSLDTITAERAYELLAMRREKVAQNDGTKSRQKNKKTTTTKKVTAKKTVTKKKTTK